MSIVRSGLTVSTATLAPGLAALLMAAGLFLGTVSTAKAQESVVVAGLTSVDGDDDYARALSGALRHAATAVHGWSVSEREVGLANLELVAGCEAPDPACLQQIATSAGAQRLIFGTIARTGVDHYDFAVSIHAYSVASQSVEQNVDRNLPSTRTDIDELRGPAREMIDLLANIPRVGTIRVTAAAAQSVRIDGAAVGITDAGGSLVATDITAGTHEVVAGDQPAMTVTVSDGSEAVAAFSSTSSGGGGGPSIDWAAVTLLSVAGLAIVGMIVSWAELLTLSNDTAYNAYRTQLGSTYGLMGDVACQENSFNMVGTGPVASHARDVCSQGNTFEILQYVFLGVAVAAGATGIVLLVMDSSGNHDEAQTLSLVPHVGPQGGGMDLTLRF